jgi:hypothetical protein
MIGSSYGMHPCHIHSVIYTTFELDSCIHMVKLIGAKRDIRQTALIQHLWSLKRVTNQPLLRY